MINKKYSAQLKISFCVSPKLNMPLKKVKK